MAENFPALRVLVVDDEPLLRWSVAETLAASGCTVTGTGDALGATRFLEDTSLVFDVVLLDYRLPDADDFSLLASIRDRWPQTPVVLMTAFSTPDVVRGALDLGAVSVLSKPFDMEEIAGLLADARTAGSPS